MTTIPNSLSAITRLIWFITGTSQGFGNQLVRAALQRGDSVVATSRQPERVAAAFSESADRLLAISLDLRDQASIAAGIEAAIQRFGRRACELLPIGKDVIDGAYIATNLAQILAWTGEKAAIERLETIERKPGHLSYGFLKLDPQWDALRGDPRFEALVASLAPKPSLP